MVVFGGTDDNRRHSAVKVCDLDTLEWRTPPISGEPPAPRCALSIQAIGSGDLANQMALRYKLRQGVQNIHSET